jgi:nucleoside-diphosphate-sugar epimerase
MTVLVTGARGDIGGAVLAGLAAAGEPVRASSRAPRPAEFPGGVEVARADLADPAPWPACARCSFTRIPKARRSSRRRRGRQAWSTWCYDHPLANVHADVPETSSSDVRAVARV